MRLELLFKKSLKIIIDFFRLKFNECKQYLFWLKDSDLRSKLKRNAEFKNIHKGKRCFIVGNGPSLKDEDLSTLENEIVFTVNKIANHPQYEAMKSDYHFLADPLFFNLSPENKTDIELLESFFRIKTKNNNPICFLPSFARKFIEQFKVESTLNVRIYDAGLPFVDGENREIDFTKPTYTYQTVIQFAIAMAIYMGFSEIYLLGCDTTSIVASIQAYTNQTVNEYAYEVTEKEKAFLKGMTSNREYGFESDFINWAKVLHLYRELYRYCNERNIKLVNCSSKTIIDSIPRESLTDVLKRGNNGK